MGYILATSTILNNWHHYYSVFYGYYALLLFYQSKFYSKIYENWNSKLIPIIVIEVIILKGLISIIKLHHYYHHHHYMSTCYYKPQSQNLTKVMIKVNLLKTYQFFIVSLSLFIFVHSSRGFIIKFLLPWQILLYLCYCFFIHSMKLLDFSLFPYLFIFKQVFLFIGYFFFRLRLFLFPELLMIFCL